jgi:hypothetical protein
MYLILGRKTQEQALWECARSLEEPVVRSLGKAAKYDTCDLNSDLCTLKKTAKFQQRALRRN